jgi:hypothetical protein
VTVWDLLAACRRRWPMLMVGLFLTTAIGVWVKNEPGVYWAQTDVIFLAPTSSRFPNSLSTGSESLIMTAGIVEHEVTQGSSLNATSSASVTLVDQGVRDGTMIRLPNIGGQWAYNYAQPVLDVEAVASSPSEVVQRMDDMQSAIQVALDRRQDQAGVDQFNRITVQASPASVDVEYRGGDRRRAVVVTGLLGMALTLGAVVIADRRRTQVRGISLNQRRRSELEPDRTAPGRAARRGVPVHPSPAPAHTMAAGKGSALV